MVKGHGVNEMMDILSSSCTVQYYKYNIKIFLLCNIMLGILYIFVVICLGIQI